MIDFYRYFNYFLMDIQPLVVMIMFVVFLITPVAILLYLSHSVSFSSEQKSERIIDIGGVIYICFVISVLIGADVNSSRIQESKDLLPKNTCYQYDYVKSINRIKESISREAQWVKYNEQKNNSP